MFFSFTQSGQGSSAGQGAVVHLVSQLLQRASQVSRRVLMSNSSMASSKFSCDFPFLGLCTCHIRGVCLLLWQKGHFESAGKNMQHLPIRCFMYLFEKRRVDWNFICIRAKSFQRHIGFYYRVENDPTALVERLRLLVVEICMYRIKRIFTLILQIFGALKFRWRAIMERSV